MGKLVMLVTSALVGSAVISGGAFARIISIAHSPRPIVDAMEMTRKLLGVPITYEDTRYWNAADLGPAREVIPDYHNVPPEMPVIRQHVIRFDLQDPPVNATAAERFKLALAAMRSAVASFNRMRGAELYGLLVSDDYIHVVRRGFIDRAAHYQHEGGVLDSTISAHVAKGSGFYDAIGQIASHQPASAQKFIVSGSSAGLTPPSVSQAMDFKKMSLRDTLTSLSKHGFGRGGIEFTWQLLCDQGKVCSLNIETNPFAPDPPVND